MLMMSSAVLKSEEGRATIPLQEGRSAPNIIEELDALLPADTSFSSLESLAKKVYLRYMTTKAHYYALGNISRPPDVYGEPGTPMTPGDDDDEKPGWVGDRQMANLTLRMRDCLWYYELCHATADGDIGRVMEIIKVIAAALDLDPFLTFALSSSGSHSGVLEHQTMARS